MAVATPVPECIWPVAATLGEGPVWWDDALWFTDIQQQSIHRFDPVGGTQSWPAPSPVGFLAPRRSGHFIAGAKSGLYDFDPATGVFALIRAVEPQAPGNRLNDAAVDARGRLWFGSMDDEEVAATGKLYQLDDDGLRVMDEGYVIPNGPTFSPDGATLYHTDTLEKIIYAFDVGAEGTLGNKRVFVRIGDGAGYPDGCVVDAQGCLWTGLFGGWAARRYSPQGALLESVKFPTANVTKLAFGGNDLTTVYATTATKGLAPGDLAAQPLAGGLFRFTAAVPGLPQNAVSFQVGS